MGVASEEVKNEKMMMLGGPLESLEKSRWPKKTVRWTGLRMLEAAD